VILGSTLFDLYDIATTFMLLLIVNAVLCCQIGVLSLIVGKIQPPLVDHHMLGMVVVLN
jgi:hypothetical protein